MESAISTSYNVITYDGVSDVFFLFPTIENMVEYYFTYVHLYIFMIFILRRPLPRILLISITIDPQVSTVRGQQTLPWVTTFRLLAVVLMTLLSLLPGQAQVDNVA